MTKAQEIGRRIAQARRLKGVRDEADVRPADVARKVGVSQATVSDWEAGKTTPRDDAMHALAKYLGVTPSFLRYGEVSTPMDDILAGARRLTAEELARAQEIARRAERSTPKPAAKKKRRTNGGGKSA